MLVRVPASDIRDNQALGYGNRGDITIDGFDLEFGYRPRPNTRLMFSLAFMNGDAKLSGNDLVFRERQYEGSIPDYVANLLVSVRYPDDEENSLARVKVPVGPAFPGS